MVQALRHAEDDLLAVGVVVKTAQNDLLALSA